MRASTRDDDDRGSSERRMAVQLLHRTGPEYVACGRLRKGHSKGEYFDNGVPDR